MLAFVPAYALLVSNNNVDYVYLCMCGGACVAVCTFISSCVGTLRHLGALTTSMFIHVAIDVLRGWSLFVE